MGGDAGLDTVHLRSAEVIAATCLATDLAMGFPFEHGLHATLVAMRLADELGVDRETASQTYYASLLAYAGCTTNTDVAVEIFGGSQTENITPAHYGSPGERIAGVLRAIPSPDTPPHRRAYQVLARLPKAVRNAAPHFAGFCEVAQMLADRLGLPASACDLLHHLTERWDGKGLLGRAAGEDIPVPIRITQVARDAVFQRLLGGDGHASTVVRERAGRAFDPAIANLFAADAADILTTADVPGSAWEATLAAEPGPSPTLEGAAIDRALAAMGAFADLVSPFHAGHSAGVAALAAAAAGSSGLGAADTVTVRRAAFVHDLGRVAVDPRTWQRPQPLSADEWEQVRLHAYQTQRVLAPAPYLAALAGVACSHHERLDGSGYHRNLTAAALPPTARLLAAADAFHAMTEPRPHRAALPVEEAATILADEAGAGRHDPDLVAAVLEVAGQPARLIERPAGLTAREAQVVGLLARGRQTKQVARELGISAKTADRHIQHAYRKIGVSTRAGATLFAVEHGLVPWGELPIPTARTRP